jgi:transcription elongation GreA/GreB family factor
MIDDRVFGDLDSFRAQFAQGACEQQFAMLRQRLAPICKRTLRKQVQPFVSYTARRAMVQDFTPSQEEVQLSKLVANYLRRPNLQALPDGQRQLISLVLWKLLASSTQAIAGALETMANRLQKVLDEQAIPDLFDSFDEDFETLDEIKEEWDEEQEVLTPVKREAIQAEVTELRGFCELAQNIRNQSKGDALLIALEKAFEAMNGLGAQQKAIIFTESRKTQDYLLELLKDTPYGQGLVLFNGTNSDARAQKIYKAWLDQHKGTDRITGSKTADTRAALVEYFKEQGSVMIATEAGAEGINLQFCSLVINYDLPWNPQRIEQRIGRCHRYGQKHDVVVVNFVDRSNAADSRVYDLLAEKFQLFEGVFGASDEILGTIGSGVDFERRIAEIYHECRDQSTIAESFAQLQQELSHEINESLLQTRELLLGHFDENVLQRIKSDAGDVRDSHEQMLLALTQNTLALNSDVEATFDHTGFTLHQTFQSGQMTLAHGRYDLPRFAGEAHIYRLSHPFAQWAIEQAKRQELPKVRLQFDYEGYGTQLSTLKPLRGQSGLLKVNLVTIEALGRIEEHLVVAALTDDGSILTDDDPEKLLKLPATQSYLKHTFHQEPALQAALEARQNTLFSSINQRNLGFFEQEVVKLDGWADDLKSGLEVEIKEIDREIKEVRRTATTAANLEEKLHWQKRQRELESKRTKCRRDLFDRQDEIEAERNQLIDSLEQQLQQKVSEKVLFVVEWELV